MPQLSLSGTAEGVVKALEAFTVACYNQSDGIHDSLLEKIDSTFKLAMAAATKTQDAPLKLLSMSYEVQESILGQCDTSTLSLTSQVLCLPL